MSKTIITAALTGAVTPAGYKIPETPQKIAEDAYDCLEGWAPPSSTFICGPTTAWGPWTPRASARPSGLIRGHKDCE